MPVVSLPRSSRSMHRAVAPIRNGEDCSAFPLSHSGGSRGPHPERARERQPSQARGGWARFRGYLSCVLGLVFGHLSPRRHSRSLSFSLSLSLRSVSNTNNNSPEPERRVALRRRGARQQQQLRRRPGAPCFFFFFCEGEEKKKKKSERQAASKSFFSESLCALSFSLVLLRSRRRRGPEAEARERPSAPPRWPLSSPERGGEGSRYVPLRRCCCCFFWDSRCWWPLRVGQGAGEALACSRRRRRRRIPLLLLRLLLRCSSAQALSTCVPGGASWPRASGKESRP